MSTPIRIPLVDLRTQYRSIRSEIDDAIRKVIENAAFIRGEFVEEFESQFASMNGVKHCVGVANGTDAIYVVLRALGIGTGDEVITTSMSWISTAETILQTGATPVFVDIDPRFFNLNVQRIGEKITSRTRAIIPVHLYGQPAEMEPLRALAGAHSLHLIEDTAQAHFAQYRGQYVGSFGEAGTFSFYPGKNLGAYGDAGAVVTDGDALAERIRRIANHGALKKHDHTVAGLNSRLDGIQAAVLLVKLKYIQRWNRQRYQLAHAYMEQLRDVPEVTTPEIHPDVTHVFHLYVIRTPRRNDLQAYLRDKGIQTAVHYPSALPFLPPFSHLDGSPEAFPVSFAYQNEVLSLPMFPELSGTQVEFVCHCIKSFFG